MISNNYAGRCRCKRWVTAGEGWVLGRRITCSECVSEEMRRCDEAAGAFDPGDVDAGGIYGLDDV